MQTSCIVTSFHQALIEIGGIGDHDAGPKDATLPCRGGTLSQPPPDSLAFRADCLRDTADRLSLRPHGDCLPVLLFSLSMTGVTGRNGPGLTRIAHYFRVDRLFDRRYLIRDIGHDASGQGGVPIDDGQEGIMEITDQMPSIRDLDGCWGTLPNAVGIGSCAIAGDNLNAGMIAEPRRECAALPIGQQIDHLVSFEIHENGAIMMTTPPGPVVDAENTGRFMPFGNRNHPDDTPYQRVGADRAAQARRHTGARAPAQCAGRVEVEVCQPGRLPRVGSRESPQWLDESAAPTSFIGATETSHCHRQGNTTSMRRHIGELANVMTVKPMR